MVLIIILLFTGLQATTLPASQPATTRPATAVVDEDPLNIRAHAAGSPERAYLELLTAVRAGRFDDARARLQEIPARSLEVAQEQMKLHHDVEALKARMHERFGPGAIEGLSMGFLSDKLLSTVRADIKGDTATLSFVPEDVKLREPTTIRLKKIDGRWLAEWYAYAQGAEPDAIERTAKEIEDAVKTYRQAQYAVKVVGERLAAGKYDGPSSVQTDLVEEMVRLSSN